MHRRSLLVQAEQQLGRVGETVVKNMAESDEDGGVELVAAVAAVVAVAYVVASTMMSDVVAMARLLDKRCDCKQLTAYLLHTSIGGADGDGVDVVAAAVGVAADVVLDACTSNVAVAGIEFATPVDVTVPVVVSTVKSVDTVIAVMRHIRYPNYSEKENVKGHQH